MAEVEFSTERKHVIDNLLSLHALALGTPDERAFHFDRVYNAEHQVYYLTPDGPIFAPVKWCGARANSIDDYAWKKLPYASTFQRALGKIGFKKIVEGDTGYDGVYRQFVNFCRDFDFKESAAGMPHSDSRARTFWVVGTATVASQNTFPDDVSNDDDLVEGAVKTVRVNAFERNAKARLQCIAHYGWRCQVCGLDFAQRYGALGENFIHVHHLRPLSSLRREYKVDPIADLRPVCPNCHAMLHRTDPPLSIEELAQVIAAG